MVRRSNASYLALPSRVEGRPLDARLYWLTKPGELVKPLRPLARLDSGEVIHVPPQVSRRDVLEKCLIADGQRVIGGEPVARIGEGDRSDSREAPTQDGPGLREERAPFHPGLGEEQMPYDPVAVEYPPGAGLSAEVTVTKERVVYASVLEPAGLSALAVVGAVSLGGMSVSAISIFSFFVTGGLLAPMIATVSLAAVASALRYAEYRLDPGGDCRP